MKKLLIFILVFCVSICFSACNNIENNSSLETESLFETIDIDETSDFVLSNKITLDSSKAKESKFDVDMSINLVSINKNGEATYTKTAQIPLNSENIILKINNGNEEFSLMCSGLWRLEKLMDGKYQQVKADTADKECNNSFGPGDYGVISCDLTPYSDIITNGKYRIISPTLNILKETENGFEESTYQNEKAFILYSEFEFVDEDKSLDLLSDKTSSTNSDNSEITSSRKENVN